MKRFFKWLAAIVVVLLVALLLWGYAPDTEAAAMKAKYGGRASQFVELQPGLNVHYRDEGKSDGRVLVLIHGSNASLHTWDAWTNILKQKYRIIRFDQAGHGLTGPHPKDCYSMSCYVEAVDRVAKDRGLEKFTLGGNSMGGGISNAYARAHPGKLDRLILVDPSGAPQTKPRQLPIGFRIAQTPGISKLTEIITPRSIIETSLRQSVSNQKIVTPENVDLYWNMLRREGNRRATGLRFAEYAARQQQESLKASPIPTLVMWGDEDKLISVDSAPWFAAQFTNNTLKIYKGIGHLPMEEIAHQSANDVLAWMEAKRPAADDQN